MLRLNPMAAVGSDWITAAQNENAVTSPVVGPLPEYAAIGYTLARPVRAVAVFFAFEAPRVQCSPSCCTFSGFATLRRLMLTKPRFTNNKLF